MNDCLYIKMYISKPVTTLYIKTGVYNHITHRPQTIQLTTTGHLDGMAKQKVELQDIGQEKNQEFIPFRFFARPPLSLLVVSRMKNMSNIYLCLGDHLTLTKIKLSFIGRHWDHIITSFRFFRDRRQRRVCQFTWNFVICPVKSIRGGRPIGNIVDF